MPQRSWDPGYTRPGHIASQTRSTRLDPPSPPVLLSVIAGRWESTLQFCTRHALELLSSQAGIVGADDGFSSVCRAQLAEDAGYHVPHRLRAEVEAVCNRRVVEPARHEAQDLSLALG